MGSKFVDLNTVSKFPDLTQWRRCQRTPAMLQTASSACPFHDRPYLLLEHDHFNKAGITEVPKSLMILMAAGKATSAESWATITTPCIWAHTTV